MKHEKTTKKGRRFGRRQLAALAGGGLLALTSAIALVRSAGYVAPPGTRLEALSVWQYVVVRALAARICAPDAAGGVSADEVGVAEFVDAYVARMPPRLRRDLLRFVAVIEHLAPLEVGLGRRFSLLDSTEQDRVLTRLEGHPSDLFRGGFAGVKALVFMGYYRDPRTFSVLAYPGPRVGRSGSGEREP